MLPGIEQSGWWGAAKVPVTNFFKTPCIRFTACGFYFCCSKAQVCEHTIAAAGCSFFAIWLRSLSLAHPLLKPKNKIV
jgi:hypothetical protein